MLAILLSLALPATPPRFPVLQPCEEVSEADAEFDKRLADAKGDAEKLWMLYQWCVDTSRDASGKETLRAVIKADTDHLEARKALRHVRHEGRWYTSQKKVDQAIAKQRDKEAKDAGLVKHDGQWVEPADLPFLEKGLVRGPNGDWLAPEDLERLEGGWVRQDLVWVSPEEIPKMKEGLWKCGEEWLTTDEADRHHGRFERSWVIPSDHLELWTSCSRATAKKAIGEMERCYRDMVKVYGTPPSGRIRVALFKSSDQMGFFAAESAAGRPAADGRRLVEALSSTFMESWLTDKGKGWLGAGASFWDASQENGDSFGVHDARMAFGLSFVDRMDPSPKAIEKLTKKGYRADFVESFYGEKDIPAWFSWGAACYGARYYEDSSVGSGGDQWWVRKWSVDNLKRQGGLSFLRPVFDLELDPQNRRTGSLINGAGLIMSFIVDGGCAEVIEAHAELKQALRAGKDSKKLFGALRKSVEAHESELRAFAGL
ncbi:MAG TPA: hypothetical protein EYQ74_09935 [Planctomycetes bacterium]|nr:hypothetical protein [Planctomycetota bacterium]HIK60804.1 hypothetical protein [Planctomycetota bacterium]